MVNGVMITLDRRAVVDNVKYFENEEDYFYTIKWDNQTGMTEVRRVEVERPSFFTVVAIYPPHLLAEGCIIEDEAE